MTEPTVPTKVVTYEWAVRWTDVIQLEPGDNVEECRSETAARRLHEMYPTQTEVVSRKVVRAAWVAS